MIQGFREDRLTNYLNSAWPQGSDHTGGNSQRAAGVFFNDRGLAQNATKMWVANNSSSIALFVEHNLTPDGPLPVRDFEINVASDNYTGCFFVYQTLVRTYAGKIEIAGSTIRRAVFKVIEGDGSGGSESGTLYSNITGGPTDTLGNPTKTLGESSSIQLGDKLICMFNMAPTSGTYAAGVVLSPTTTSDTELVFEVESVIYADAETDECFFLGHGKSASEVLTVFKQEGVDDQELALLALDDSDTLVETIHGSLFSGVSGGRPWMVNYPADFIPTDFTSRVGIVSGGLSSNAGSFNGKTARIEDTLCVVWVGYDLERTDGEWILFSQVDRTIFANEDRWADLP